MSESRAETLTLTMSGWIGNPTARRSADLVRSRIWTLLYQIRCYALVCSSSHGVFSMRLPSVSMALR